MTANPWLAVPLADYEAHMALPSVAQAPLLADVFAEALARFHPRSVAVIGCAGGNGFERVAGTGVERLVGIDVNPGYVATARARYAARIAGLQCLVGDIQRDNFACEPVDLAFTALLFEYVDPAVALARIRALLRSGGILVAVVQLATDAVPEVTPSPYASLAAIAPAMRLVPPDRLGELAGAVGYRETSRRTLPTTAGKQLHEQVFTRSPNGEIVDGGGALRHAGTMQGHGHRISLAEARDQDRIFAVWESAVRATHHFLSEADIEFLIPLVRQALARATPLHCLRDAQGEVYAFLGVGGANIDMLFVHDDARGRGAGRALVEYAIRELGATTVDVSEQNPLAVGFYQHLGFRVTGRSPLDPQGRPFPVLHMTLAPPTGRGGRVNGCNTT